MIKVTNGRRKRRSQPQSQIHPPILGIPKAQPPPPPLLGNDQIKRANGTDLNDFTRVDWRRWTDSQTEVAINFVSIIQSKVRLFIWHSGVTRESLPPPLLHFSLFLLFMTYSRGKMKHLLKGFDDLTVSQSQL